MVEHSGRPDALRIQRIKGDASMRHATAYRGTRDLNGFTQGHTSLTLAVYMVICPHFGTTHHQHQEHARCAQEDGVYGWQSAPGPAFARQSLPSCLRATDKLSEQLLLGVCYAEAHGMMPMAQWPMIAGAMQALSYAGSECATEIPVTHIRAFVSTAPLSNRA